MKKSIVDDVPCRPAGVLLTPFIDKHQSSSADEHGVGERMEEAGKRIG